MSRISLPPKAAPATAARSCSRASRGTPSRVAPGSARTARRPETTRLDATVRLLSSERRVLGQWAPVHLHVGASDAMARVTILSSDILPPGATGFAQIVLSAPLPLRHGDRFVLRDASAQRNDRRRQGRRSARPFAQAPRAGALAAARGNGHRRRQHRVAPSARMHAVLRGCLGLCRGSRPDRGSSLGARRKARSRRRR